MNDDSPRNDAQDPLIKRVLTRIEAEHITPRPRWTFTAANVTFWALGALAVLLGALASSAALFEIANRDWALDFATRPDRLNFIVQALPIAWVAALVLFAVLGYRNIRQTKRGYRYPLSVLLISAVAISLILGGVLFVGGVGEAVEEGVGDLPPFYRPVLLDERMQWSKPSEGLLIGEVEEIASDQSFFMLRAFDGMLWQVSTEDLRAPDLAALSEGSEVRIVGVPATTSPFHACFVFAFHVHGLFINERASSSPPGFASTSERFPSDERSDICKGVRPYGALRALSGN